jgi:S-adenosylmethionine-diacylglycerol 3-amino-3-carboxypropyl transferase
VTVDAAIAYGQCWEDADVLLEGLAVRPGDVCLSIASAGDNTFALLTQDVSRVIAVDCNPAQIACLELRAAAYACLAHEEFLELYGSRPSTRRAELYERCRAVLGSDARAFWDARPALMQAGFGHAGRFERYVGLFRRWLLPAIHGRGRIERLLRGGSARECREFYASTWDSWRWRALFRLFFSRPLMARLGRDPACFAHAPAAIAEALLERARTALAGPDVASNAYVHWLLTGEHRGPLPLALRPEHYLQIRARLGRLEWRCQRLEHCLAELGPRSVDRFNLSNVFEYMDQPACAAALREVARVGRPGGRALYWNLFVERERPADLAAQLAPRPTTARRLHRRAGTFFYNRLVLEQIMA